MKNSPKAIQEAVERGKEYLLKNIRNGICQEFAQLRHGPSYAWTTACVGSTLSEFAAVPNQLLEALLSLRAQEGGWAYNPSVPPDADSTLRVLQLFRKIGFKERGIIGLAEKFVLSHQQADGGFSTYRREALEELGYDAQGGWLMSHPCVTAVAINQLSDSSAVKKARRYLHLHLALYGPVSYWWKTGHYILYEMGKMQKRPVDESDPVDLSLALLLKSKLNIFDLEGISTLLSLQQSNGGFVPSRQFRIPRPHQTLKDLKGQEEIVEDQLGIFSTCASIITLARQRTLFL